tara:strand:- start:249 stop:1505 length:1257 start_codon:yes stop_codon:yes gene_type:complete
MNSLDPKVITFGCRLNAYESEVIGRVALEAGLQDVVIFNTCAVTAEAERQARQAIRRARRKRPNARIVVTGCAAQIHGPKFLGMPEVDQVIGNSEKLKSSAYAAGSSEIDVRDIMKVQQAAGVQAETYGSRTRAFLRIQTGCDHRCTFCVIPFARGPNRSIPINEIVSEAKRLVDSGYREVVLTGVDIGNYGEDFVKRASLADVIGSLLASVPSLSRLRISSIDPACIDENICRLFADEERLMPHLHLSLQAGDDLTLRRMRRRHKRADAVDLCARLRALRPDIVFGADFIAGFPTETDKMFSNTRSIIDDCGLTFLHVFPYSERPGTPAARMPLVPVPVRRNRARILRAEGARVLDQFLDSCIGSVAQVLLEEKNSGRSERFAPIKLSGAFKGNPGSIHHVNIVGRDKGNLIGKCAE